MNTNNEAYQLLVNEIQNMRTQIQRQHDEIQSQQQTFQTHVQSQQERENNLRTQLDEVLTQPTPQPPAPRPTQAEPSTPTVQTQQRPRARQPDPELFSGENPEDYPPFKLNLHTKFTMDAACFENEEERVYYAYSRLTGKASRSALPWLLAKRNQNSPVRWDDFIQVTDKAFSDPDLKEKALVRVNTMKQGRKSLEEFINEFDGELLNAGGMFWNDSLKKTLLETGVNWQILEKLIGKDRAPTYDGYCEQLRRIDYDMHRMERLSRRYKPSTHSHRQNTPYGNNPDPMDWEPTTTQVAATNRQQNSSRTTRRENRWASEEELQSRRNQRRCLRCGNNGHFVKQCRTTLTQPGHVAAVVNTEQRQEEETTSQNDDSEKE